MLARLILIALLVALGANGPSNSLNGGYYINGGIGVVESTPAVVTNSYSNNDNNNNDKNVINGLRRRVERLAVGAVGVDKNLSAGDGSSGDRVVNVGCVNGDDCAADRDGSSSYNSGIDYDRRRMDRAAKIQDVDDGNEEDDDDQQEENGDDETAVEEGRGRGGGGGGGGFGGGKKKKGYGKYLMILGGFTKAVMLYIMIHAVALLAGKALVIAKVALAIATALALKKSSDHKTSYEIIKHPHYSHVHSQSSSVDYDHGAGGGSYEGGSRRRRRARR